MTAKPSCGADQDVSTAGYRYSKIFPDTGSRSITTGNGDLESADMRGIVNNRVLPPFHQRPWCFPVATIIIVCTIWGVYIGGILDRSQQNNEEEYNHPWYERISPYNSNWWYYRVSSWPQCNDMRGEAWRLISLQFVHDGISHILGNTLCILAYGSFFELNHPFHSLSLIFVYHISLVFGTLGFTFLWPYQGLIGASPGAYGLLGACLSLCMFFRPLLNHFVAFCLPGIIIVHIIGDIMLYIYSHNGNIAYASHVFGAVTGFLFVTAFCCLHNKTYVNAMFSLITMPLFLFVTAALLYIYIEYFPPLIYESRLADNYDSDESCCAEYFSVAASFPQYSKAFIRSSSTCSNGVFRSPFFNVTA